MKGNFGLLLILAVTSWSCDYDTNEHYINPLEPPGKEKVVITLGNDGDTVNVAETATLQFDATTVHAWIATEVYFDGKKIYTLEGKVKRFLLDISTYRTGYFPLELRIITAPNSGSLSSLEGSEFFTSWKSFVVFVDKVTPEKSSITSVAAEDGTLRIRWTESNDPNFEYYEVRKYTVDPYSGNYRESDTLKVTDRRLLFVDDRDFLAGSALFRLRVVARGRHSEPEEREYISPWTGDLSMTWINEATAELKWRKNPYYNNISRLEFTPKGKTPETINDPDDTVAVYTDANFKFGKTLNVQLKVVPKGNAGGSKAFTTVLHKGTRCHKYFHLAEYNKPWRNYVAFKASSDWRIPDSLFVFEEDKVNPVKMLKLDIDAISITFSPDGTLYVLSATGLLALDPVTLQQLRRYDFASLPQNFREARESQFEVTSNNLAKIGFWYDAVLDLNTMSIVFNASTTQIATIAPDGSQLFAFAARYAWNGSTYAKAAESFSYWGTELWYVQQHSADTLSVIEKTRFRFLNAQSCAVIKQYALPDSRSEYDHGSKMLYVFVNGEIQCRDLRNETTTAVPIDTSDGYIHQVNKYLVCSKGFYIKLD